LLLTPLAALHAADAAKPAKKPNIIFIMADDLGYGDLGCYGATKVKTPNVDRLAAQGLRFTDGHSMASVCTPSRYSFLTGEYAFRKRGTGIASGDEGLLIEPGRTTVPALLKRAGYTTGIVGKWHLGLGKKPTDFNGEIKPGPLEIGFDYAWIMPATADRVPCVWVENRRVVNLDPADPIKLDYRLDKSTDAWKIIDVNVGGIWLVQNYRSQFAGEITKGGIDGLVNTLVERNKAAAK
jgi:arylsulfatase A-like enzyme